jgi:hypothetical protein
MGDRRALPARDPRGPDLTMPISSASALAWRAVQIENGKHGHGFASMVGVLLTGESVANPCARPTPVHIEPRAEAPPNITTGHQPAGAHDTQRPIRRSVPNAPTHRRSLHAMVRMTIRHGKRTTFKHVREVGGLVRAHSVGPHHLCRSPHPGHARAADTAGSSAGVDSQGCHLYPEQPGVRVRLLLPVEHTNRARHPRGSPGVPVNAAKVGLKFADEPKEIDVEPRILGTRLRITRAYRSYGAGVPSR